LITDISLKFRKICLMLGKEAERVPLITVITRIYIIWFSNGSKA